MGDINLDVDINSARAAAGIGDIDRGLSDVIHGDFIVLHLLNIRKSCCISHCITPSLRSLIVSGFSDRKPA